MYMKKVWENKPSRKTPITAEELNRMENGIEDVDKRVTELENDGGGTTFYSNEKYVTLNYADNGVEGGGQVIVSNNPIDVSDELEAGTWLLNFNVTFSSYTPECQITIWLGQSYRTSKCVQRVKRVGAETVSFSFLDTIGNAFAQYLLIDCNTSNFDGSSGSDQYCSVKVNAIKIA